MKNIKIVMFLLAITLTICASAQAKEEANNYYLHEMSEEEIQEAIDSLNHNITTRTKPLELEVQEKDFSNNTHEEE